MNKTHVSVIHLLSPCTSALLYQFCNCILKENCMARNYLLYITEKNEQCRFIPSITYHEIDNSNEVFTL